MNSRTSSSASFDLVAQNENDVTDTLHGQNNKIEPTNDKESTSDQQEADQLEEMKQLKGEEIAKIEEFQKQQQQHNIDESAEIEDAPIDQGTSQLNGKRSAKIVEECQKQQQQNIDALTEAQKGNDVEIGGKMGKIGNLVAILTPAGQWRRRYDLFRIAGPIVLFIFIIYMAYGLNAQNEKMNEMRLEMTESLKSVQAMVGAELGIGNSSMAAQEEEEQTKLEELKHLREKITQFELELKGMKEIDPYRIAGVAGAIVLLTFVLYTVLRLNAQNAIVVAELEQQKQSNANKFAELEKQKQSNANKFAELEEQKQSNANKFAELEGHQNQQQHNIDALTEAQKRKGLTPQNRWNSSLCHNDLKLSEPNRLIVKKKRDADCGFSSVLAVEPIPKEYFGFFYFEVKILVKTANVLIGLANGRMPLDEYVGGEEGTYGYGSDGTFWGHEFEGCSHWADGRPLIKEKPSFGVGDVVGCGIILATRQTIYTLNGERLDTANLFVDSPDDLFPCVSLGMPDIKIEANFGPKFQFNIAG